MVFVLKTQLNRMDNSYFKVINKNDSLDKMKPRVCCWSRVARAPPHQGPGEWRAQRSAVAFCTPLPLVSAPF